MDPTSLVGPVNPAGYPAPYWLLVALKLLGFSLHMVPMHLWYAGILVAMVLWWRGGVHGQRWSGRLMGQMPIFIALGINFGIVPLLFMQVAYYRAFYPATLLMAWPWMSILVMLALAYYGVYFYAVGLRQEPASVGTAHRVVGWVAALFFMVIGFIFANGLSLMTNLAAWPDIWRQTSIAGAPLGTGLNTGDPTLWPRWLMMFGLALTTTAAYTGVDAAFFAHKESADYRQWASAFAVRLYTVGLVWFALAGSWYVFGTWSESVRQAMFSGPALILTVVTALGPGLPWLLLWLQRRQPTQRLALLTGLAQFGLIALNAVSRQIVQNTELAPYMKVAEESVDVQWSPLIVFLVLFVTGLGVIGWMVVQIVAVERQPVPPAKPIKPAKAAR